MDRVGIRPVTITPLNAQQLYGKNAIIAGWGYTNEGKVADALQEVNVRILSQAQCEKRVQLTTNRYLRLKKNHICTSSEPYALGTCVSNANYHDHRNEMKNIYYSYLCIISGRQWWTTIE